MCILLTFNLLLGGELLMFFEGVNRFKLADSDLLDKSSIGQVIQNAFYLLNFSCLLLQLLNLDLHVLEGDEFFLNFSLPSCFISLLLSNLQF